VFLQGEKQAFFGPMAGPAWTGTEVCLKGALRISGFRVQENAPCLQSVKTLALLEREEKGN
jgi:hypothetical protein